MTKQAKSAWTIVGLGSLLVALLASRLGASGIPSKDVLTYSGTLISADGTPLSGDHNIEIKLWTSSASNSDAACTTESDSITLQSGGRFSVTLPDKCATAVSTSPDTWVEVLVDGASLGRSKLGAVPYAIEAQSAGPAGMIAMFEGACPSGWAEYTPLRGRFPRGEPDGNPAALGAGGNDDAVVVAHTHMVTGTTAVEAEHTHPQNVGANPGLCPTLGHVRTDFSADTTASCPYPQGLSSGAGTAHAHTLAIASETVGEPAAGQRLPSYQEVIFCKKL